MSNQVFWRSMLLLSHVFFKHYSGVPSSARLVYMGLMKKKKQHTRQIKMKNGTTKYNKSNGGSIRLGSKVPF